MLDALPVERGRLEVILCDVFDRESPLVTQHADTVIVLGQNEHLYNRNVAFNTALTAATGQMVVFCDGDHPLPAEALAAIADKARACATERRVLVNAGGVDRSSIHAIALDSKRILPVSTVQRGCYGLRDVALSVPTVVGGGGAEQTLEIELWPKEVQALKRSGGVLQETLGQVLAAS